MDNFEIAFSLVMLVLGLAIVDVLHGLVRTLRRPDIRAVGWLTPLLGVAVICDLTTFWAMIASMRNVMPSLYQALSAGMLLASVYYVAAGMVFPASDDVDLNEHYLATRRRVLGLVIACNVPVFAYQIPIWTTLTWVLNVTWLVLALVVMVVRPIWANYAGLGALILLYVYMFTL